MRVHRRGLDEGYRDRRVVLVRSADFGVISVVSNFDLMLVSGRPVMCVMLVAAQVNVQQRRLSVQGKQSSAERRRDGPHSRDLTRTPQWLPRR